MSRILLLLENRENTRVLSEFIGQRHELVDSPGSDGDFDLVMVDAAGLKRNAEFLKQRKREEDPVLLPVLLVTTRHNVALFSGSLSHLVDEIVLTPVEKVELFARIEMLLRARKLSLELRLRKDDVEAFIDAMTHDLRAPLRTVTGFAEAMAEDQSSRLDAAGKHQLDRIQAAVRQMWELIESLVEFSRIGRKAIKLRSVSLDAAVRVCIEELHAEVQSSQADIVVKGELGLVQADPALLKIAILNLMSNGLKYVSAGVKPRLAIWTTRAEGRVRLMFHDNGIGLRAEDQQRIFTPFVRLHGVEDYPGLGLGLSAARKVIDIMGGQTGVVSSPGEGSTFWIEVGSGGNL